MNARSKVVPGRIERLNPGVTFKAQIDKAAHDGLDPSSLLLQLTRSDVSRLKRDKSLSATDISFANGEMRYLGVRISEGEVAVSALVVPQA
ncbi:MAG TPA: hypothetical protein VMU93_05035 [Caulobacteraceae bacterium]|nr:hypothetical protein [Caulobacteraceae bacterium]